jgi:DNA polymerase III epsilon subunit-like protein
MAARQVMNPSESAFKGQTPAVAIDCEMVDCSGEKRLARASIVNYNGHILYDSYIRPEERVTNFLTAVSGISPNVIKNAPTLAQQKEKVIPADLDPWFSQEQDHCRPQSRP